MNNLVSFESLAEELEKIIEEYSIEVIEVINEVTVDTGEKLKTLVQEGAPVDTGRYRRAITVTATKSLDGVVGATVHVKKPHYRLAHLLEKQHALRSGGRSKAQPHWSPARSKIEPIYITDITRRIEGIK